MKNYRTSKTVALYILSAIVLLLLAEAVLRLGGAFYYVSTVGLNARTAADERRFRILTIGESTTADAFPGVPVIAWPRILEAKLRDSGIDARVYNEGVPGTSTSLIASRLPEYLQKYQPHLVISMIGVNDNSVIQHVAGPEGRAHLTLQNMQVAKLTKWIASVVRSHLYCSFQNSTLNEGELKDALGAGLALARFGKELPQIEEAVREAAVNAGPEILALTLMTISVHLREDAGREDFNPMEKALLKRAFEIFPYSYRVASMNLAANSSDLNNQESIQRFSAVARKITECGPNVPDAFLFRILSESHQIPELQKHPIFQEQNVIFKNAENSEIVIAANYHQIYRNLRSSNAYLVAMQYPTRPISALEKMLKSFEDYQEGTVSFVSNEKNFEEALNAWPYEKIFSDRFKGNWGHTTTFGHDMIAEAAKEAVAAFVKKNTEGFRCLGCDSADCPCPEIKAK